MSFDINNTDDLIKLRDEITLDVAGMGYAALPYTDTKKLEKFINDAANNVTPQSDGPVFSHDVLMQTWAVKGVLNEMTPWIEALIAEQGDITQYEVKYRDNCGSDSLANLDAIIVQLARPEVTDMFGQGTVLSQNDLTTALNYTGDL